MIVLLGISGLISLVAALVLGIRLLLLASRTHGVPELAMGLSFLIGGFLGLLLVLVGNPAAGAFGAEAGVQLFRIGMSMISIGVSCTYVFVWKTFRSDSATARFLTRVAIACILGSLWPLWTLPAEAALADPLHRFGDLVRLGGMLWGCAEAMSYHAIMRRRRALGLADPVVTNRFLLWGIAMAAGVAASIMSTFMSGSGQVDPNHWPYLLLAIFTTISPIAQWLAFFPPRSYAAWVRKQPVDVGLRAVG